MKSKEDIVLDKYEMEFSRYCENTGLATHKDAYIRLMENGAFWDWLEETHYDEWKALEDEYEERMTKETNQSKVYDPPMTDTEQYLLNKEREEEHKSYDY